MLVGIAEKGQHLDYRGASPACVTITASIAGLVVIIGALLAVFGEHKTVSIGVNGTIKAVKSYDLTVGDVLKHNGVEVSAVDVVTPGLGERLKDGDVIEVKYASSYRLNLDGNQVTFWSAATSLGEVAAEAYAALDSGAIQTNAANFTSRETASTNFADANFADSAEASAVASSSSESNSGSTGTEDAEFSVTYNREDSTDLPLLSSAGNVQVVVDGKNSEVELTGTETTSETVAKAGYQLKSIDEVRVSFANGQTCVNVETVVRGVTVQQETLPYETEEVDDPDLSEGETRVIQSGQDGVVENTVYVQTRGGQVLVSSVVGEEVIEDPVTEIIAVGSGAADESNDADADEEADLSSLDETWAELAQCESGGDPSAVSADGSYHGLYQFSLPTWESLGGTGLPSEADVETQTEIAKKLQARSGWGQWPHCAAQLGLLD